MGVDDDKGVGANGYARGSLASAVAPLAGPPRETVHPV